MLVKNLHCHMSIYIRYAEETDASILAGFQLKMAKKRKDMVDWQLVCGHIFSQTGYFSSVVK